LQLLNVVDLQKDLILWLHLTLQQGSLSSEAELAQYFSVHDVPSQSSLSETMAMGSSDDDMLHCSRTCITSMEESAAPQSHGKATESKVSC